ncbi:ribonuclease H [Trifolium pratense]|uniref:Ribonuclease H n=1 Tax=Trifolium pratense TaxID=57577 RepID=A0A2K3MFQ5_TRIPR|nr:ribonuclease H [Trifolium pratense]
MVPSPGCGTYRLWKKLNSSYGLWCIILFLLEKCYPIEVFSNITCALGDAPYTWLRFGLRFPTMFLFMAAIWWIWRARNALCLDSELVSLFTLKMCITDYAILLQNCFLRQQETTIPKLVRWNAHGGTDEAWIHCFVGNLGVTNILHAELMAIYKGLHLAWELNIMDFCCYSDSLTALKLIIKSIDECHHYAAIINNIKDILNRNWQVAILYTYREGNACAKFLAKHGAHNN